MGMGGVPSDREARRSMHRLLAAGSTVILAAALAVGAGLGMVAALNSTPDQPNSPLVSFRTDPTPAPTAQP